MAFIRFLTLCVIFSIATAAVIPVLTAAGGEPGFHMIITPMPYHRRQSSVAGRLAVGAVQGLASAGSTIIGQEIAAEIKEKEKEAEEDKKGAEEKEHEG